MNIKKVKINIPNLMQRIEAGESIRKIAIESGYSYSTLNRYVREQKDLMDEKRGFDKYNNKKLTLGSGYSFIICGDLSIECGISDIDLNDEISLLVTDQNNQSSIIRLEESDQEFNISKDKYVDNYGRTVINTLKKLVVNIETFQKIKFEDYKNIVIINYKSEISKYAVIISEDNKKNNMKIVLPDNFNVKDFIREEKRGCYLVNHHKKIKAEIFYLLKDAFLNTMLKRDGSILNIHIFKLPDEYLNRIKDALKYENEDVIHAEFFYNP